MKGVWLCDGFSRIVSCARPGMALQCGMGMSKQEAGSKGGRETVRRYGREWMKELGKRGLRSTANKYFAGSVDECMSYLRKKGAELQIVALADQEGMSCVEVPILLDPDSDPYFEEKSWRDRVTKSKSQSRKR